MGSDVTSKAIQHQIARLKVFSKAQLEALESGTDPKDVTPSVGKDNQGQELDTCLPQCIKYSLPISFLYSVIPFPFETPY